MKDNPKDNFKLLWGAVMSVIYVGIAYLVVFTPVLIPYSVGKLSTEDDFFIVRIFLGIVLFAYGLFRGYRVFKSWAK